MSSTMIFLSSKTSMTLISQLNEQRRHNNNVLKVCEDVKTQDSQVESNWAHRHSMSLSHIIDYWYSVIVLWKHQNSYVDINRVIVVKILSTRLLCVVTTIYSTKSINTQTRNIEALLESYFSLQCVQNRCHDVKSIDLYSILSSLTWQARSSIASHENLPLSRKG